MITNTVGLFYMGLWNSRVNWRATSHRGRHLWSEYTGMPSPPPRPEHCLFTKVFQRLTQARWKAVEWMNEWIGRGEPCEVQLEKRQGWSLERGMGNNLYQVFGFYSEVNRKTVKDFKQVLTWPDLHCLEEITRWQPGNQIRKGRSGEFHLLKKA